jgi:hypothetical protein
MIFTDITVIPLHPTPSCGPSLDARRRAVAPTSLPYRHVPLWVSCSSGGSNE